jgi:peptidoglycan/LPS O-acetylase OafA/YrhL
MNKRFYVLDSFRGLAAIFVVMYHSHYLGTATQWSFFRGSGLFVEFFFVLSGFVLTHGYAFKKNLDFKNFFISRTFRIFPLHVTMLFVFLFLEVGKLVASYYGITLNNQPFTGSMSPSEFIPNLLLLQSWLPNTITLSWNPTSWSISTEYYMYMIFYASLLIKQKLRYVAWTFLSFFTFYFIIQEVELGIDFTRGISCFFAGGLTYLIYKKYHQNIKLSPLLFTIIEMILILLVIFIVSFKQMEHRSFLASILFIVQVFVFAFEGGVISKLLKLNLFTHLGKISYSIYLTHPAIIFIMLSITTLSEKILHHHFTLMALHKKTIDFGDILYNNIALLLSLVSIILLSNFTYKYIELKGQSLGNRIKEKMS